MKLRFVLQSASLLRVAGPFLCAGLLCVSAAGSPAKTIRLRNETITTPPASKTFPKAQAGDPAARKPASGLFLIQFEGALEASQRAQLNALGVELLNYVPDDAFIAQFDNAIPSQVQALDFVRYIGPYRPEHKVHPRLAAATRALPKSQRTVAITLMLSPRATPAEVAQARAFFTSVAHESRLRQGTYLCGTLSPASLEALAQASFVLWLEQAPRRRLVDEAAAKLVGGDDGQIGTPTITQQLGFDGSGVTVSVADTGLDSGNTNALHPDLSGRVVGFQWYGDNILDGADGHGHGTHCAGILAGNAATGETDPEFGGLYGLGVASRAKLFIQRLFDDNGTQADPLPSNETLVQDAVHGGAVIGSHSWGNDVQGEYDTDAAQFDELVRDADRWQPEAQPYIMVFAAGNAGPGSLTMDSPASAKNVIAVGASQNVPSTLPLLYGLYADGPDAMADFSSRGPCEDGRIKPDVVAPGTWIASAASSAALDMAAVSWMMIDDYYVYMGGTSMAAPHVAGAAAVFVQYYQNLYPNARPSPALVKAALINSADALDPLNGGPGPIPNNEEGWGRVNLASLIITNRLNAPRHYEYVDQTILLTNGGFYTRHILVQGSTQPLKITLAYTDVYGFAGAIPALVNDLDLEVIAPDGTLYRGNQFAGDDSAPNAPSPDILNNVEAVHLTQPAPGDYLVRVRGRHIVQDACPTETAAIDQDFALIISGDLARPGAGTVLLDRPAYTAPGELRLTVFDPARAASNSVSVVLRSTTEPNGETVVLQASGNYGAFTGAMATVAGSAAPNGKLELQHGDSIEAVYEDSAQVERVARAVADLIAPTISNVAVATNMGVLTISWQTPEPARSIIRYRDSAHPAFDLAVTNLSLNTAHSVRLTGLVPGTTYFFYLISTDAAGNATTNNNAGTYFSFIAPSAPTVLLVDDWDTTGGDEDEWGATDIPDSTYTNALNAAGFSYAFWKVAARGSPQLSDLQPFPVVIWRTTDDAIFYDGPHNTLSPPQQVMVQSYLNGGGSFLLASMEILSRLGNVPFRKNALQVGGFKQNPDPLSSCVDCDEDHGVSAIVGAPGNPVTDGFAANLDYSGYPNFDFEEFMFGPDFSDTFTPTTNAVPILFDAASGRPCGMSYPRVGVDSPGRIAFLSFPLDAVPATGPPPGHRAILLRNLLKFLTPGAHGIGTLSLNNDKYSVPAQVIVEAGDSDRAGQGPLQVTFTTSSRTNQVAVILNETTRPGLFRGFLTLVAAETAPNQLPVSHGDIISATYFDASNNSNVIAQAAIDAQPPLISQVQAVTGFGDATVSWRTSKPADSLVQYGESVLLGRTAHSGTLTTNHAVSVAGLLANRDYYYQVVSRDQAGNTTVDNNEGALYTFTTRPAPRPPWFDSLEDGVGDWTVVPDPLFAEVQWTLGTPANGLMNSAHSGTNAWGSVLHGEPISLATHSFLISPAIDLSGVSQATLTFWHCLDFDSMFEQGQVRIITSIGSPPAEAPVLEDFSGWSTAGWEEVSLPLTAHIGKTVQLVWEYQGVMLGAPHGWLVDDISITGVAGSGTLEISKNLGQGRFTLSGPISRTGTAPLTTITNAPPGPYTVRFSDVSFYQTPHEQSLTLTNGGTLAFTGNYVFLDINDNGIADSWERYYFGLATTNRAPFTDSDGDGMSDYAEFMAGTNPTNAASKLVFLGTEVLSNQFIRLEWAAIPGRLYQVQTASRLTAAPARPGLSGTVDRLSGSFTLHVHAPTNLPYAIQASSNLSAWTSIYTNANGGGLDWVDPESAASARRFYRTLALSGAVTNANLWTPVTEWLQAAASPMRCIITNANAGLQVFRVEVRP